MKYRFGTIIVCFYRGPKGPVDIGFKCQTCRLLSGKPFWNFDLRVIINGYGFLVAREIFG